jgi:transposase
VSRYARLTDDERIELNRLLISGYSFSQCQRALGVARHTVQVAADKLKASGELQPNCGCGRPRAHRGCCKFRNLRSLPRLLFLARRLRSPEGHWLAKDDRGQA